MSGLRYNLIPAVYGYIERDDKVLLLRRTGTNYGEGLLCLPAGHLEPGEDLEQGLHREMREEIGIVFGQTDSRLTLVQHRAAEFPGDVESLDFIFRISDWNGEPRIMEPDKCLQLSWVDPKALPRDVVPYLAQTVSAVLANEPLITIGFEDAPDRKPLLHN